MRYCYLFISEEIVQLYAKHITAQKTSLTSKKDYEGTICVNPGMQENVHLLQILIDKIVTLKL